MSRNFNLLLATETLLADAQHLGVAPEQLQNIKVTVSAEILQHPIPQLWLIYHIQLPNDDLAAQLSWPTWEPTKVIFTDYLWKHTCLECFIASSCSSTNTDIVKQPHSTTGYIEINASPNGHYAVYQFDSYRNPSTLPPTPLRQTDRQTIAHINWSEYSPMSKNEWRENSYSVDSGIDVLNYHYERSFGIPLDQILCNLSADSDYNHKLSPSNDKKQLHPCVILRFNDTLLYFASDHASPPDFHQRRYWSNFAF